MSKNRTFVEKVRKLITGNLQDPNFHSEDICKLLKISRTQLYRNLKKESGKSYQEIYNEIRIEKARELLLNMNYNIKEISFLLGYRDPSYFVRVFRNMTGTTPRSFRKISHKSNKTVWLNRLNQRPKETINLDLNS